MRRPTWTKVLIYLAAAGICLAGALAVDNFRGRRGLVGSEPEPLPYRPPPPASAPTPTTAAANDMAPDFRLPRLDTQGEFHLAQYRGKAAVVLIFGSFSCDVFDGQVRALEEVYRRHAKQAVFLFVNIREAGHPADDFKFLYGEYKAKEPPARRRDRTRRAMDWLGMTMPAVIDDPKNTVDAAYKAFPTRAVIVDRQGRIVFTAGMDDHNAFRLASVLDDWLQDYRAQDTAPPPRKAAHDKPRKVPAVALHSTVRPAT